MIIVSKLEKIIAESGLNIEEILAKTGITNESLFLAQSKRIKSCSLETLIRIALALQVKIEDLYEIKEEQDLPEHRASDLYDETNIFPCLVCGSKPVMESDRPKGRLQDVYRLKCACGQACFRWSVTPSAAVKSWNGFAANSQSNNI